MASAAQPGSSSSPSQQQATDATRPPANRQSDFEQAVAYALHLWPALTLAVQNLWGGPDSADKRDWFAGAIVDLFPAISADASPPARPSTSASKAPTGPELEDVETVLLQVMLDEFDVNVDDDSGLQVAGQIIRARSQCLQGQGDELETLRQRFQKLGGKRVDHLFNKAEDADQDTDWESGDSDCDDDSQHGADVVMDDAPALARGPRQKTPPEVDEDGFTKVTKKRR